MLRDLGVENTVGCNVTDEQRLEDASHKQRETDTYARGSKRVGITMSHNEFTNDHNERKLLSQ